jgi:DNA-binding beta-propeller fold protein YncE
MTFRPAAFLSSFAAASLAALLAAGPSLAQTPTARFVLGVSDVDMVGTAYIDGRLGPTVAQSDTLSIFDPRASGANVTSVGSIEASNSVFSPPSVMDVAAGGRIALVIETLRPRAPGMTMLPELEATPGNKLRAFDISTPNQPRLLGDVDVNARPQAIAVNPAGDLAVVAGLTTANGLNFVAVGPNGLGRVQTVALPVPARADVPFDAVNFVRWHPSGRFIAVHMTFRNQIVFLAVNRAADGAITLAPWGNTVGVNKFPLTGAFSPDGRFYFTSDLMWGMDVEGFFRTNQGLITTIRVAPADASGEALRHVTTAVSPGGLATETIAVSPDGRLLAALSMRNTGQLPNDPIFDRRAGLSLYRIDAANGALSLVNETLFEAALPQGLAFDPSGELLYVGVNEYAGEEAHLKGAIEVWNVRSGDTPALTRTDKRMRAPRGVHTVVVVR